METEQELNKKLAEWAGFTKGQNYGWSYPDGDWFWRLPYFDESLDACFKWLVPKLRDIYSLFLEYDAIRDDFCCYLGEVDDEGVGIIGTTEYGLVLLNLPISEWAETPALALCRAIEKLIGDKNE